MKAAARFLSLRISTFVLLLIWPTLVLGFLGGSALAGSQGPDFTVRVLSGNDIVVDKSHAPEIIVEVRNRAGQPVVGADVTFAIPEGSPGAFAGGLKQITVKTDAVGHARSGQLHPGTGQGPFTVSIRAVLQGQTDSATVRGSVNAAKSGSKAKWFIIIGAGAAAGILLATRKKSSSTSTTGGSGGTITIGPPTVGQP